MTDLTGIVLAGGVSSRMGRDKASLAWKDSDILHEELYELGAVCSRLIVVSNVPRAIAVQGVAVVADSYLNCGPLAGIHAGLAASESDYNFIIACDMPYVDHRAVAYMAAAARGYHAAVPFVENRCHPLHAVYHRHCLAEIEDMLEKGNCRITDLYPKIDVRLISAAELACFEPECGMLRNLNQPEDFL